MKPPIADLIEDIDGLLPAGPPLPAGGSLLILVGLPGSGKSHLARHVRRLVACAAISTDRVRHYVRHHPTYTAAEMVYIYEICFNLVDRRLQRRQRVIFDGSNYLAERRHRLREIALRYQVPTAVAHVQASAEVIRARLAQRQRSAQGNGDLSDAGWPVYRWMLEAQEPVAGPHLILDTTDTPAAVLAQQLVQYWKEREQALAPADDYL